ncbi:squalene synthase HpnC [Alysiella filiformis]|uniref:Squalene synthase HpnC n=1 Tax=Alysiella filiformis DSM 16848 TaxID=1120981 RepID=A0A286EFN8_9NEIS|nr:squalene synthase HpnC [Alysiella filiformis]QMT30494.1 squalene synthase HpnC [Alysiella filiformis]UBQ56525.1 squalene synthase HpnC [Alysiella filiformis DSM 16848]SOD69745.1 squalene synthase HpnC [Alysiella filiformis DSM 16848]
MSVNHYENFPVGSILLPKRLRRPIHAIYAFARTADDIADEGDANNESRLQGLQNLRDELDLIQQNQSPKSELMHILVREAIVPFKLPLQPFYDLLSAFSQDVVKKRYENFGELVDYARRSANPVGRLMLHLYGETDERSLAQSDGICTALQLINFWQDVAIDWQKDRVYIPQEDLQKFGVSETQIAAGKVDFAFQRLMAHECERAFKMLKAGSPLGRTLKGRVGFELRMIVLGGQTILQKLDACKYDVFTQRPILQTKDWLMMLKKAW